MLEYSRIDISEGINTNKTGSSCELFTCHYWYFPGKNSDSNQKYATVVMIIHKNLRASIILQLLLMEEMIKGFIFKV